MPWPPNLAKSETLSHRQMQTWRRRRFSKTCFRMPSSNVTANGISVRINGSTTSINDRTSRILAMTASIFGSSASKNGSTILENTTKSSKQREQQREQHPDLGGVAVLDVGSALGAKVGVQLVGRRKVVPVVRPRQVVRDLWMEKRPSQRRSLVSGAVLKCRWRCASLTLTPSSRSIAIVPKHNIHRTLHQLFDTGGITNSDTPLRDKPQQHPPKAPAPPYPSQSSIAPLPLSHSDLGASHDRGLPGPAPRDIPDDVAPTANHEHRDVETLHEVHAVAVGFH
eukprot:1031736-Rhodomonas_salina.1